MAQADDLNRFRRFAEAARWQFAKTYVESYPHEYTLRRLCDPEAFREAIALIEEQGVVERFWSRRTKYLYVGDRKYWHMGDAASEDPAERPGLINRTWVDVSLYRENARALGYDDERLESLVERWKVLLSRARAVPSGHEEDHGAE